ncbi:MAG: LPS export ABC transporter permease LptG [Wenzhouxiangellaceae bacterium]|nr:LPS export ABC transporter permease LptG [Wenzhouxiangellaceae bacterium]
MPGVLTRYLAATTGRSMIVVALVLTGLYLSVDLVREAGDIEGGYGPAQVALYLLRTLPARLYDLFPYAALIGGMLALGQLSARRELVAMRVCGFHNGRIVTRVLAVALLFGLVVMLVGERLAPELELDARIDREQARSGQVGGAHGRALWLRDGAWMVHVGLLVWEDDERVAFADLRFYRVEQPGRIETVIHADSARHVAGQWRLDAVTRLDPDTGQVQRLADRFRMDSEIAGDVFRALATRPRLLPIDDIQRIRAYLEANGQDDTAYVQAFWRRVLYPVNTLAMLFSGLALLLGTARRLPPVAGVFAGVSIGMAFVVIHRIVLGTAPVLPVPVGVTHMVPAMVFAGLGAVLLRRR